MSRVVELAAVLRPTGARVAAVIAAHGGLPFEMDRPEVGKGVLDFRVRCQNGIWMWAVVETWESGHEEILLGAGGAPNATAATVAGLPHFEQLLKERGA